MTASIRQHHEVEFGRRAFWWGDMCEDRKHNRWFDKRHFQKTRISQSTRKAALHPPSTSAVKPAAIPPGPPCPDGQSTTITKYAGTNLWPISLFMQHRRIVCKPKGTRYPVHPYQRICKLTRPLLNQPRDLPAHYAKKCAPTMAVIHKCFVRDATVAGLHNLVQLAKKDYVFSALVRNKTPKRCTVHVWTDIEEVYRFRRGPGGMAFGRGRGLHVLHVIKCAILKNGEKTKLINISLSTKVGLMVHHDFSFFYRLK